MKILWCHIENFGKLHDLSMDFTEGWNEICKENGWGKSTLMAFISVMFYGFAGGKKRNQLENERARYMPWQGGSYGGSLCFETAGRQYVITRAFGKKESEDVFELRDGLTNMPSSDYTTNVGEKLFGINQEGFQNSVYLGAEHPFTKVNDSVHAKLNSKAVVMDDLKEYQRASNEIADTLNHLTDKRSTGELYKLKDRQTNLKTQLQMLDHSGTSPEELAHANQKEEKLRDVDAYIEKDKKLQKLLIEQSEFMTQIAHTPREPGKTLETQSVPKSQKTYFLPILAGFAGILLLGIGSFCFIGNLKYLSVLAGALFVVIALCIGFLRTKQDRKSDQSESSSKGMTVNDPNQSKGMAGHDPAESIADEKKEALDYEKRKSLEKNSELIDGYTEEIGRYLAWFGIECNVDDYMQKLMELKFSADNERQILKEKQDKKAELMEELSKLQEEIEKKTELFESLKMTQIYLQSAKEAFSMKYADPLKQKFDAYYEICTGEHISSHLDADFHLTIDENGMQRDVAFFSTGSQDVCNLCLRFAMIDAMYEEEKPVIFMDDPFVHMDEKRFLGMKKLMNNLTSSYQVFYFTCHRGVD